MDPFDARCLARPEVQAQLPLPDHRVPEQTGGRATVARHVLLGRLVRVQTDLEPYPQQLRRQADPRLPGTHDGHVSHHAHSWDIEGATLSPGSWLEGMLHRVGTLELCTELDCACE